MLEAVLHLSAGANAAMPPQGSIAVKHATQS